jgi:transposase-like protein
MTETSTSTSTKTKAKKLGAYVTRLSCDNEDCPVRGFEVETKDYEKPPLREEQWRCPACGKKVQMERQRTFYERERETVETAIGLINTELYMRDHRDEHAYPANALLLERLPEQWKYVDPVRGD